MGGNKKFYINTFRLDCKRLFKRKNKFKTSGTNRIQDC